MFKQTVCVAAIFFLYSVTISNQTECQCTPNNCNSNAIIFNEQDKTQSSSLCIKNADNCCKSKNVTTCGIRNADGLITVVAKYENDANLGEFPWVTAVLAFQKFEGVTYGVYQCSGTLIHKKVVLTTAHCIKDLTKTYKVRVGEWDSRRKHTTYPYHERLVKKIIIHPNYDKKNLFNDVALLFLARDVTISKHVNIACLPKPHPKVLLDNCFTGGWGKDNFGNTGKFVAVLKKREMMLIGREDCQNRLRGTRLGAWFVLDSSFICAIGVNGSDTCQGDGGSPLVCPMISKDRYEAVGMVAWGIGCSAGSPAVFVNVPMFKGWIDDEIYKYGITDVEYNYND